jgi:cold shock CspA family protein
MFNETKGFRLHRPDDGSEDLFSISAKFGQGFKTSRREAARSVRSHPGQKGLQASGSVI